MACRCNSISPLLARTVRSKHFGTKWRWSHSIHAPTMAQIPGGNIHYSFSPAEQPSHMHPMVLLAGTSQTINSWVGHAQSFAKHRNVLQYEARGQGRHTDLPLHSCDLHQHAQDFCELISTLRNLGILPHTPMDLVGFSFGGRVAAAIASRHPELVRRVVLTGVPRNRGSLGRTILKSWLASLKADNLEAFVWQSIVDGHSPSFIRRYESRLDAWVSSAVKQNRVQAIKSLIGSCRPSA